jgi:hypothetical protein
MLKKNFREILTLKKQKGAHNERPFVSLRLERKLNAADCNVVTGIAFACKLGAHAAIIRRPLY